MRIYFLLLSVFLISITRSLAQDTAVAVFNSGMDGYKSFRIPAIIQLKNGNLLAFAEGRVNGAADFGDVNIVMKRSVDQGRSWSAMNTIVDYSNLQAGNPAPVLDLLDPLYPKGKLYLFYNTGNNHESEIRKGNGIREVWFISSIDNGRTWSAATNITNQVHFPNQPSVDPAYQHLEDWRSYANTPGHALQLNNSKYKGRIFIIANHSSGAPQKKFTDYDVHGYYSDDHCKTFHLTNNLSFPGSNESMAAELSDGKLMINTRNQKAELKNRIVAISSSGGEQWDTVYYEPQLIDPVCQGSLLNIKLKKNRGALLFCNNEDSTKRDNLTIRFSLNDGKTWQKWRVIGKAENGYKGDFTAYSDLVQINYKKVAVLYEFDNYRQILFKPFEMGSLK